MYSRSLALLRKIEDISERASIDAGSSYEQYIRLFTQYFDEHFKRKTTDAFRIALEYGYVPKNQR
ncbi:hypothetical protein NB537_00230 [Vibrio parahaemolyticus]|nr:hypothetical protein [Vibrio parahaemolyticus]MCR9653226.1 hypothetical protein [Vibrio parahaemolyticus]MDF5595840.1 hypothetical protein [Vibrio parahaemolyticus]